MWGAWVGKSSIHETMGKLSSSPGEDFPVWLLGVPHTCKHPLTHAP